MLTKIVLIDPTMYKSDKDEFIKIFPEMINHFTKMENLKPCDCTSCKGHKKHNLQCPKCNAMNY